MTTIKELVGRFADNANYDNWDHAVAREWMRATRSDAVDVRVITEPKESLTTAKQQQRERIREETLSFVRRYFDDRPDVVRALDELFAEFGMVDERERRREFLRFESLYDREEVAVLLLKHLQPIPGRTRYTWEDIAEHFLASDRSINDHIRALRPVADRELAAKIFGQVVQMDTARGTNVPESTTHPLFLALNMVELYTLVDLLARHVGDPVEGRVVRSVLMRVMEQTTDYADKRLSRIEGLVDAMSPMGPWDEGQVPGEAVMFSEKEGIEATVRFVKDGAEKVCCGRISRDHRDRAVIDVEEQGRVSRIPYQDIVKLSPRCE